VCSGGERFVTCQLQRLALTSRVCVVELTGAEECEPSTLFRHPSPRSCPAWSRTEEANSFSVERRRLRPQVLKRKMLKEAKVKAKSGHLASPGDGQEMARV
jgi:hypothetical protein